MNRVLVIETCDQCKWFDNEYYSYNEECFHPAVDKIIKRDEDGVYAIPEDCQLDVVEEVL